MGGMLLVTGPMKLNGVPLKRVNQRMCIATSTIVDVSAVSEDVSDAYFARPVGKKARKAFLDQDSYEKAAPTDEQKKTQATIDDAVKVGDKLVERYLRTTFALGNGDQPHRMKF